MTEQLTLPETAPTQKRRVLTDPAFVRRFWAKVLVGDGCWEWQASKCQGYGQIGVPWRDGPERAHRVAYEMLVGPIPDGLTLDHECRNHPCVRPDHLEPVTQAVNVFRGVGFAPRNAGKLFCDSGHALSGDNLYRWRNRRFCRACRQRNQRRAA